MENGLNIKGCSRIHDKGIRRKSTRKQKKEVDGRTSRCVAGIIDSTDGAQSAKHLHHVFFQTRVLHDKRIAKNPLENIRKKLQDVVADVLEE